MTVISKWTLFYPLILKSKQFSKNSLNKPIFNSPLGRSWHWIYDSRCGTPLPTNYAVSQETKRGTVLQGSEFTKRYSNNVCHCYTFICNLLIIVVKWNKIMCQNSNNHQKHCASKWFLQYHHHLNQTKNQVLSETLVTFVNNRHNQA